MTDHDQPAHRGPVAPLRFEDLSAASQELLRPRYERLGYLGEIFAVLGHNDAALQAFVTYADASGKAVDPLDREVVALSVSAATGAEGELFQHERRSLTLGFTREQIAAIERLDPDDGELPAGAGPIVAASVRAARGDWAGSRAAVAQLAGERGEEAAVGVLLQVGYYLAANALGHVLALTAPVTSIFDDPDTSNAG